MQQSRRASFVEAITNVTIGFFVSVVANVAVLPFFGLHPSMHDAVGIGGSMTAISMVRSYGLRRFFEMFRGRF